LWGFSFDLLLSDHHIDPRRTEATPEQRQKILSDLEARLTRLSSIEDVSSLDPHKIEGAALRLAAFYRKCGQHEDMKRVLDTYASAYLRKSQASSAMNASAWLRVVHETLSRFQLREEANEVLACYRDYAKKAMDEMPSHRESMPLDPEQVRQYLREMSEGD
jgi:hypothetical protein